MIHTSIVVTLLKLSDGSEDFARLSAVCILHFPVFHLISVGPDQHVRFVSCSATISNPDQHMRAVFGIDVGDRFSECWFSMTGNFC
jgi:hypothetical protein